MNAIRLTALASLMGTVLSASAMAGVVDSPLPILDGKKSKHVYTIPGVVASTLLATAVTCTSLEKAKDARFTVQYFPAAGGDAENIIGVGTALGPGETKVVSTQGTTLSEGTFGLADSNAPRSGRVVATSAKLSCTAAVLERGLDGTVPNASWSLTIIKKTKQKGD